eukprot:5124250-Alexandrium_andersonii.AAC.1
MEAAAAALARALRPGSSTSPGPAWARSLGLPGWLRSNPDALSTAPPGPTSRRASMPAVRAGPA